MKITYVLQTKRFLAFEFIQENNLSLFLLNSLFVSYFAKKTLIFRITFKYFYIIEFSSQDAIFFPHIEIRKFSQPVGLK